MALAASSSTQLGCGRDIDQVWDHLDQAPDGHELTCPYCQAARADLAGLARATRAMRDDDATNPDLEPGPGVLDRILAVARAEVRRGRRLPLDQPSPEQTTANTVSEQAITAVVRRAGDRSRHVRIRHCDLALDDNAAHQPIGTASTPPRTDGPTDLGRPGVRREGALRSGPAAVTVSLRVSVSQDVAIADASNELRAVVIEAVMQEVGMRVVAVDIIVEDLHNA